MNPRAGRSGARPPAPHRHCYPRRHPVTFTVASGATFTPGGTTSTAVTDANGQAVSASLRAGSAAGPVSITASTGSAAPAAFTAMVTESTASGADVTSTLGAPANVRTGQPFTVTLKVTNRGPATANKTVAVLVVPPGVTVRDAAGGRVIRGAIIFDVGKLAAKASTTRTVSLVATPTRSRTRFLFSWAMSATPDPNPFNNPSIAIFSVR